MSDYASAINAALGVTSPSPAPAPATAQPMPSNTRRVFARVVDVGRVVEREHRGIQFVVREFGCVTFGQLPLPGNYWSVYFTDEELVQEGKRGLDCSRFFAIHNAIDRYLAGAPVWTGPWDERGMTL